MVEEQGTQRISRLTPLADVLNGFQTSVAPVAPREEAATAALGKTLAADLVATQARPAAALAVRDGYAVRADTTSDASAYAPMSLSPKPIRVDTGDALPPEFDAVALLDSITPNGEATAPIAPGEGVLSSGGDARPGVLRLAGARLRRLDVGLMLMLGLERVAIREPQIHIVCARDDLVIKSIVQLIVHAIESDGAVARIERMTLDAALANPDADAVIGIGGTGSGRKDFSVDTLARRGRVEHHGIAIAPGETTAVGFTGTRPVLLLPGRLDGALAGWLTVGRRLLARLAFRMIEEQPFLAELSGKVASPLGLAEVVPVRRRFSQVEPLGATYLSPQILARSDGWILVPADSEGYAPGTRVPVRAWP